MQDYSTGKFNRFSPEAYWIIGLMDGVHTLDAIWRKACERLGEHMPTQDEVIGLLSKLHRSDVLQSDLPPDIGELFQRYSQEKKNRLISMVASPTSVKFPLFDPNRLLDNTAFLLRPLFSRWGGLLWLFAVVPALVLAGIHWKALTTNMADRVLSMENLVLIWLIYPVLKLFHEFAHAYAVKRWGGEVHEMGIMLLVFVPIPYVDASSATAFGDKRKRMLVGAAGILAEVFFAALAMIVWAHVPPGSLRAVAYNVMIIACVSTLLFNGNPLLRFDAYYVLADFLEIPNMGLRSNQYIGYLFRRYLLGISDAVSPAEGGGERIWLALYGVLSFVYRIYISIRIVLLVAGSFFVVGALMAVWAGYTMLVLPVVRLVRRVGTDVELIRKRGRILAWTIAAACFLFTAVCLVPLPYRVVAKGVVWPSKHSRIYAGVSGFIHDVAVAEGQRVVRGEALIRCANEDLETEEQVLLARLQELQARYRERILMDKTEAKILEDEMERVAAELKRVREKVELLVIKSEKEGVLLLPEARDLPGRFVRRGDPLGFVLDSSDMTIRVVIPQAEIDVVGKNTRQVNVRLASLPDRVLPAEVQRIAPAASSELPSLALSLEGGGDYALDPRGQQKAQVLENLFQMEIFLLVGRPERIGEMAYVRFDHEPEALAFRWYRGARRLLLKKFDI